MRGTKLYAILAAMFMDGAFLASPELRAYAANTVRSIDIVDGQVKTADLAGSAVTAAKIKDGEVKAAEIASNAIGASEIADGAIAYGDVSRNLIAVESRTDCNCGGTRWDPDRTRSSEDINDARINGRSVVVVSAFNGINPPTCWASAKTGFAIEYCTSDIREGMGINYAIFNNPAYGG